MPPGKEIPFFSHDQRRRCGGRLEDYLERRVRPGSADAMPGNGDAAIHGRECRAGVGGRARLVVPERIRRASPDTKLVAILRDPVERARSHYRMQVMRRAGAALVRRRGGRAAAAAGAASGRPDPTGTSGSTSSTGEYGRILSGYLATFPGSRSSSSSPMTSLAGRRTLLAADARVPRRRPGVRAAGAWGTARRGRLPRRLPWLDPRAVHGRGARRALRGGLACPAHRDSQVGPEAGTAPSGTGCSSGTGSPTAGRIPTPGRRTPTRSAITSPRTGDPERAPRRGASLAPGIRCAGTAKKRAQTVESMPSRLWTSSASTPFQATMLTAVASAAPSTPSGGMRIAPSATFAKARCPRPTPLAARSRSSSAASRPSRR